MRSKGGVKPAIPCLTDSVDKLEGLGGKTRRNLLDVRRCVRNIDARAAVPAAAPNEITTGGTSINQSINIYPIPGGQLGPNRQEV